MSFPFEYLSRPFGHGSIPLLILCTLLSATAPPASAAAEAPLRVVVSTPDLRSLVQAVAGEQAQVTCLSEGPADPHEIEIRIAQVRELNRADLFIQVGLGLENAWLKRLLQPVDRAALKPGGSGNLNLGPQVRPLEGQAAAPAAGSYHEDGNPHYLLDPVEGLKAARAIRDRLTALRPSAANHFDERFETFRRALTLAFAGPECADEDLEELAAGFEQADSAAALAALEKEHKVGGWLGALLPYRGRSIVGDHDLWPYFARRFGLTVLGYLEPSPGVPPTTRHLRNLAGQMKKEQVRVILTAPYFDQRHVQFAARQSGARIVPMAHQTAARTGTSDYLSMLDYNVRQLKQALQEAP
jgi:ABC-type Zn uptake system ZnuABC Zn-binding protein ZnuA